MHTSQKTAPKFSIYDTVGTLCQKYNQTRSNPTFKHTHTVALSLYNLDFRRPEICAIEPNIKVTSSVKTQNINITIR